MSSATEGVGEEQNEEEWMGGWIWVIRANRKTDIQELNRFLPQHKLS